MKTLPILLSRFLVAGESDTERPEILRELAAGLPPSALLAAAQSVDDADLELAALSQLARLGALGPQGVALDASSPIWAGYFVVMAQNGHSGALDELRRRLSDPKWFLSDAWRSLFAVCAESHNLRDLVGRVNRSNDSAPVVENARRALELSLRSAGLLVSESAASSVSFKFAPEVVEGFTAADMLALAGKSAQPVAHVTNVKSPNVTTAKPRKKKDKRKSRRVQNS